MITIKILNFFFSLPKTFWLLSSIDFTTTDRFLFYLNYRIENAYAMYSFASFAYPLIYKLIKPLIELRLIITFDFLKKDCSLDNMQNHFYEYCDNTFQD